MNSSMTFETNRKAINSKSNSDLYSQHGLYSFVLNKNRTRESNKQRYQSMSPSMQMRPSTALIESKMKQKGRSDVFATIQVGRMAERPKEEQLKILKIQNQSSHTPHKVYVNDYRIIRAMSALKKLKKQRQFMPCPFTLGINVEQCSLKPKVIKQRAPMQASLNRSEMRVKKVESPMQQQKQQFSKWEQYDDTNLFDLNFLNNNLFKYEF